VGPIPSSVQSITIFSAGIMTNAKHSGAAHRLIKLLASKEARPAFRRSGLEPIH
jgi:molybdate transport system substrate-binding protein